MDMMQRLGQEHRNFLHLLDILERQLAVFERGERPDYDVVTAIADYFTGFPERCHHPMEDLILRRLRERYPAAADAVGDLDGEHESLGTLALDFRQAVRNVLDEAEMRRETFRDALRHFIDAQRAHMKMEQERFFPVVQEVLTPEDWAELETAMTDEEDPVFGGQAAAEFEDLRHKILQWQAEDDAAAR